MKKMSWSPKFPDVGPIDCSYIDPTRDIGYDTILIAQSSNSDFKQISTDNINYDDFLWRRSQRRLADWRAAHS